MGQAGGRGLKGLAQFCGNGEQRLFRLLAFRDVVEEDGDLPLLGPADSERVDVVEPVEGNRRILKPPRLAGQSNPPINLEPMLLVRRRDIAHPASDGVRNAGLLLKDLIDFQKAVVNRVVTVIEQYLDHAETLVDRIKQRAVLLLRLSQLLVGGFRLSASQLFTSKKLLTLRCCPARIGDVAHERVPATVGQDVRAHLDRHERAILAPLGPLGSAHSSGQEQLAPHRLQAGCVLSRNDVEECFANKLAPVVAEEAAGGFVDICHASVEIGLKKSVRRELDNLASALNSDPQLPVDVLDSQMPFLRQKRQVDDDSAVHHKQQRLRDSLTGSIACERSELEGAKRQADQERTNPGPTPATRLVTRTAVKNSTNGAPVPVKGISQMRRANVLATVTIAKR